MGSRMFRVFADLFSAAALVKVSCLTAAFPVHQTGSVQ